MIKSAKDVWDSQENRDDFEKACDSVMRAIEKASAGGKRDCAFKPHPSDQYHAVRAEFEKHGYRFRPTGYIGGVWQHTEEICW